ncbi:MAG: sulfurtransferase TusA family protein [Deltaproteobacteria bacterium]|nr:sulfurtransferase TusA family protein [Deltaproteobacteria bacterium]
MTEIDARGFGCPIPVVKTKQAMENNPKGEITVLVDSNVAKENVSRLAESKKYSIEIETTAEEEYKLLLKPYEFNDK